ncbi:MAG: hypothetical protein J3Q66DRAFT_410599 [Benniella sp.]|nr:MAG: hypothetical protein J3Q66DRAFT_410599 [Benniella sp.]
MLPSLLLPTISTLTTLTFTFISIVLFNVPFSPSVHAQKFRPFPSSEPCYAFTEGQGLYILGGTGPGNLDIRQSFMLDLSVSWNTSDPVFKNLTNAPNVEEGACTMTNNGEGLFVMEGQVGYIYNVKSESWATLNDNGFSYTTAAATDPETGFIYLPGGGEDFKGRPMLLSLDLKTKTINKTLDANGDAGSCGWNAYLRSMVFSDDTNTLKLFTPSKVSKSSTGWGELRTGPLQNIDLNWNCGVSMQGGTKMVFHGYHTDNPGMTYVVYVLDVVKRTWKKGPSAPRVIYSACAATGDQFIMWGGKIGTQEKASNTTFIYNIKTEKWTTSYIAPPSRSTTTMTTDPSLPSQTSNPKDASSSDKHLVVIIVAVIGSLLAIILGLIFRYHRQTRRLNHDGPKTSPSGSSTDLLDIREHSVGSSRRRDPSESGSNSGVHVPGVPGRLHQGSLGARELSEHPHAILEDPTARRNLQEGALEVQLLSHHPHAMVGDGQHTPMHSDKVIQGYNRHHGDKEELRDQ